MCARATHDITNNRSYTKSYRILLCALTLHDRRCAIFSMPECSDKAGIPSHSRHTLTHTHTHTIDSLLSISYQFWIQRSNTCERKHLKISTTIDDYAPENVINYNIIVLLSNRNAIIIITIVISIGYLNGFKRRKRRNKQ